MKDNVQEGGGKVYQALYREWRPKTFSEMIGQEAVIRTLRNQVTSGRIAHAYLFCGTRGTGKTTAAKVMARAVNCQNPQSGDPCCQCASCVTLMSDASFDVYEMDAASNSRVEEIRDLLEKVDYPPQFGKYKVYIIDEVHMLSGAAFNALLKTLEEPPEYMVFILATTEPQKLPATILSRCQRFDFGRLPEDQIAKRLQEAADKAGVKAERDALNLIARSADGAMRDAFSLLDMCFSAGGDVTEAVVREALGTADRDFLLSYTDALRQYDGAKTLKLIDELMRSGRDVGVFLRDVSSHIRLLLSLRLGAQTAREESLLRQSEAFSAERLLRILSLFMKAESDIRWASSARTVLEVCSLSACQQAEPNDIQGLLEKIGELETRLHAIESGAVAVSAPKDIRESKAAGEKKEKKEISSPQKETLVEAPEAPLEGGKTPKDIWNDAMKAVRKGDPALLAFLAQGKYGGYQNGVFSLEFPEGQSFYADMLNDEARRGSMEKYLNAAGAVNAKFEAHARRQSGDIAKETRAQQSLDALASAFGRDKIEVIE